MQWRYGIAHFVLASVVTLGLTLLMVVVDAQAQIAFASNRDGDNEIYVMDADGGNLRRLTNNSDGDRDPVWSPDGKRIAFKSDRDGHVNVHGWPTHDIYVMDTDGSNQQNLTNNPADDWDPPWSPDGKRIAFMADRKGNLEKFNIYVMDADGGNLQNLTNHRAWDGSPSWSPDSQRIVFHSERDGDYEIYVMDADGGNLQNLTNHPRDDSSPAWYTPPFAVAPAGKKFMMWAGLK